MRTRAVLGSGKVIVILTYFISLTIIFYIILPSGFLTQRDSETTGALVGTATATHLFAVELEAEI